MDENTDTTDVTEVAPSWMLDESTAGAGERPAWMPDKFKTMSDMAKSYQSLEDKLGSAPDKYNFESSNEWLDSESLQAKNINDIARENHISQDALGKIMGEASSYLKSHQIDADAEFKSLGADAGDRLETLGNWMKSNFSEDTAKEMSDSLNTAASFRAMEEIKNKMLNNMNTIPNGNHTENMSVETVEEVQNEMANNFDKYKEDPKYRAEIQAKLGRATKDMGLVDKSSF